MTVVERVRELFDAFADGDGPGDEWLRSQFSDRFMASLAVDDLRQVLAGRVPSRWDDGRGFEVVSSDGTRLAATLGTDLHVTASQTHDEAPRFDSFFFRGRFPGIESRLHGLLAAFTTDDAPVDDWIAAQFTESFIEAVPAEQIRQTMVELLSDRWDGGRGLVMTTSTELGVLATLGDDLVVSASLTRDDPPRFEGLRFQPKSTKLDDERLANRPWHIDGVPPAVVEAAKHQADEMGLIGVVASSLDWELAGGFVDLDQATPITVDTVLCAYSISKIVTATVVLRLVADGTVELDGAANDYLDDRLRLSDDRVTVRHLLSHSGGVVSDFVHFASEVPDVVELLGPVRAVSGTPGTVHEYSNAGFAVLGHLISVVEGESFEAVAQRLVLSPLGMDRSSFPRTAPIAGYDGNQPAEMVMATVPCAGGMWMTASDLVRLGQGWSTLLPAELAEEATRPQIPGYPGQGLGWRISSRYLGHSGGGRGFSASLLVDRTTGNPMAVLTNREGLNAEEFGSALLAASADAS